MSDSETCSSHGTGESTLIGQLPDELKASSQKGNLFQPNLKVKEGLELNQLSQGETIFGSDLLMNIDKPPYEETPPLQHTPLPTNILMKKTKSGPPAVGFFSVDHSMGSFSEPREPTRGGSLSPGPTRKPTFHRKGSLSPGPVPSGHPQKMKWPSKETPNRYQPYSASKRSPHKEKKQTSLFPREFSFDTTPKHRDFKKEQWDTKRFDFPHHSKLVSSIFSSHPKHSKEISALAANFRIQVDKIEDGDHLAVQLEGHPKGIAKAINKLNELVKHIEERIVLEVMSPPVPCALLPMLACQHLQDDLKGIERKNRVRLLICKTKDNHLSLDSEQFVQPFVLSSPESLPKLVDFKDYLHISPDHPVHTKYKWQAQNDSGEFQRVPSKVEEYLNECYYSGLPQFSHNGERYQIDVVDDVLFEVDTGVRRKLLKQPLPAVWSYSMGAGLNFIDFEPEDSEKLEHLLHYGGADIKVLTVQKGTVDFDNMALVDLGSELAVPLIDLQRNPAISTLPTYGIRLAIKGLKDDIEFAKLELSERLKRIELVKKEIPLPVVSLEQQHVIRAQVVNNARQYFVELSTKEDNDLVFIIVRGEEKYIQNVHLRLQSDAIKLQQHLLSRERQCIESQQFYVSSHPGSRRYPEEWRPQKKPCELQEVTINGIEWIGVLSHMRKTMPNVNVVKIERVQNRALWDKYSLEMYHMKERNGANGVNEKLLFHGTSKTDPKVIVESVKGIDFRYSNQDRSLLWGKGAYFAVNASYSDNYSHQHGKDKQMLLVRVLTGRSCPYRHHDLSLTKPPPLSHGSHTLYDTVNGNTNGSLVYVVYDHDRAYPAYLITYR